ncbi:O-antigen ligase family protein [Castellaniella sp.]|uniref:O-antigen ligase family protein n=1 Tax=Castellaniella sp. TaxID=1955812 RepID=UPI002B001381|nr:O-antigen ligase family protein [Castellaniella sp.]
MTVLLGVSALLMAWGSLRYTLTPLGYWVAWGLWAVMAAAYAWPERIWGGWDRPVSWMVSAFSLLILGMVVSAAANYDGMALYQAVKILVIGVLCWITWRLAARAEAESLIQALYGVLALVILVFFLSKAFASVPYSLGGSREGDVFARAGVLWKAGLFFLPLFIADWLCHPRRWVAATCAVGACVFLVSVDGSRTGLLLIVAVGLGFGIVLWWRGDCRTIRRRPWALPLAVGVLLALLLLNAGMNAWKRGNLAGTSSTGSSQVEALVNQAIAPVVDNRLGEGDAPRIRLLRNGLEKSRDCFPLGCGFGSTAIDAGYGIPMNVHNAYLGALADFGILGLLGMLGFVVASVLPMRVLWDRSADPGRVYFVLATSGSALAYCVALNLHTFSTEMSEWGYLLLMLAFAWRPARVS